MTSLATERRIKFRRKLTDFALGCVGVALAAGSLYFPWHIYLNPDAVTQPRITFSGNMEPVGEPEDRYAPLGLAYPLPDRVEIIDPVITGSVEVADDRQSSDQPTGADSGRVLPGYRLLHAANGRALVRDVDSIFMVRRGTALPGGRRVERIGQVDGAWQVFTSDGVIAER